MPKPMPSPSQALPLVINPINSCDQVGIAVLRSHYLDEYHNLEAAQVRARVSVRVGVRVSVRATPTPTPTLNPTPIPTLTPDQVADIEVAVGAMNRDKSPPLGRQASQQHSQQMQEVERKR